MTRIEWLLNRNPVIALVTPYRARARTKPGPTRESTGPSIGPFAPSGLQNPLPEPLVDPLAYWRPMRAVLP